MTVKKAIDPSYIETDAKWDEAMLKLRKRWMIEDEA